MSDLLNKKCAACETGTAPLTKSQASEHLAQLSHGWELDHSGAKISRIFEFKGFYKTMAFVNAIAWIAHTEKHHPDLLVSYNQCTVNYSTHAIGGLSENDFICAAKVDNIIQQET